MDVVEACIEWYDRSRRMVVTNTFAGNDQDDAGATMDTKLAIAGNTALRMYSHMAGVSVAAKHNNIHAFTDMHSKCPQWTDTHW